MPTLTSLHLRHICGNWLIPLCKTPLICIWARFPFDDKWFLWCKPSFEFQRILQFSNVCMKIGKSALFEWFSWSVATGVNSATGQVTRHPRWFQGLEPDTPWWLWNLSLAIRRQPWEVRVGQLLCTVGLSIQILDSSIRFFCSLPRFSDREQTNVKIGKKTKCTFGVLTNRPWIIIYNCIFRTFSRSHKH